VKLSLEIPLRLECVTVSETLWHTNYGVDDLPKQRQGVLFSN